MAEYIIPAIAAIAVAAIEAVAASERKQAKKQMSQELKSKFLQLQLSDATMQLSMVTANAVTGGHNNGNVEAAKSAAKTASENYSKFLKELGVEHLCA